jgi:hypothetical protein
VRKPDSLAMAVATVTLGVLAIIVIGAFVMGLRGLF